MALKFLSRSPGLTVRSGQGLGLLAQCTFETLILLSTVGREAHTDNRGGCVKSPIQALFVHIIHFTNMNSPVCGSQRLWWLTACKKQRNKKMGAI